VTRHVLLTGASSGIGRALAQVLAARGDSLILIARRAELLDEVAAACRRAGADARALPLDIADPDALVAAMRRADDERPIDVVIANAGAGVARGAEAISWEGIRRSCEVSFVGAAATVTALLPRMVARRSGHVVGVSSLTAIGGALPRASAYAAAKAGFSMLLDCLRLDVAPAGVAVTTIHAGFVDTAMTEGADHPLPFLWSPDRAARFIAARLDARPARVDFPWPLATLTRAAKFIPRPLYDRIARGLRPPQ
jgi:short-subunit dehydrogenase